MASGGVVLAQHTAATKIRGGFSWWIEWPKTPKWICKITDKMGSYRPLPVRSRVLTPLQGLQHLRTPCITSKGSSWTLLVPGQFQVCNRNCSESSEWIAAGATVESSFFLFAFLCSRTCSFWCLFLFLFQLFLVFVVLVPMQSYFYLYFVFFFSFSVLLSLLAAVNLRQRRHDADLVSVGEWREASVKLFCSFPFDEPRCRQEFDGTKQQLREVLVHHTQISSTSW